MRNRDPIAEAARAYALATRQISEQDADEERRRMLAFRIEMQRLLRREVVKGYFRRLTRMGVAIDPRGALFLGPRAAGKFRMIRL